MSFSTISYNIILASKSPRRQNLLKELGFEFEIIAKEVCNKWDDLCRVPEKRWSKQDAATKET